MVTHLSFLAPFPHRATRHTPDLCPRASIADWDCDAVVIGAGIAGLAAAKRLGESGRRVRVIEASDGVGGRMRSDNVEGFILDRGFQVFVEGYPRAQDM